MKVRPFLSLSSFPSESPTTFSLGLHDDAPGHLRVQSAEVGVFSSIREAELELVVRVECFGFELALRTVNRMGNVVAVDPSHLRASFHRDSSRSERKIVNLHFRY